MPISDLNFLNKKLRLNLSDKRILHMMSCSLYAYFLCEKYVKKNCENYIKAAYYHDIARDIPHDTLKKIVIEAEIEVSDYEFENPVLLHAPVGAFLVEKNSLLSDKKFIRAIRRHTLGPAEDFETKFLMLVDFAEYLRKFEASKKVRKIAEHDIESAIDLMLEYKKNWRES